MDNYDAIIIGSGPAGSKCAMELAKAGKKVALIEKEAVGGTCLNKGCIPSKTYLYLVELLDSIKKAKRHGIEVSEPKVIWEQVKKRKDQNVKMLGMGLKKKLENSGVQIIEGEGEIVGKNQVEITNKEGKFKITGQYLILAVGTKPLFLNFTKKGTNVISSTEILDLEEIPKSLAIIGGGIIGVEMASVFLALGTKVEIIEKLDFLMPGIDREISEMMKKSLEKKGCQIELGAEVLSVKDTQDQAEVIFKNQEGEQTKTFDKALVVIGRTHNLDLPKLENVGIKNDGKKIILNENLQTSLENVFVMGDAAFRNLTAYGGETEGEMVASYILGAKKDINYDHIPTTVFSHPEIAQIGLTEEKAKESGANYEVKKSQYAANAKAAVLGEREGMVKVLSEKKTGKVLGVSIIGFSATDLIHQCLIPVIQGMKLKDWQEIIWSHPVLSEVVKEALESEPE